MNTVGFVIHLRRAEARLKYATDLCDNCGVPCEILDATDGRQLSDEQLARAYQPPQVSPDYPFPLGPSEVGCFLSHRNAWQALLATDAASALIIEDDMQISAGFRDALALAQRHIETLGYIQFQTRSVSGAVVDQEGPAKLYLPEVTPLRTSGQLVSRKAAEKLLELTAPFDRPVDTFLQMHWHTGIQVAAIDPSGLVDVLADSTVSSNTSIPQKITREWHRLSYRRTVARLSRKSITA